MEAGTPPLFATGYRVAGNFEVNACYNSIKHKTKIFSDLYRRCCHLRIACTLDTELDDRFDRLRIERSIQLSMF